MHVEDFEHLRHDRKHYQALKEQLEFRLVEQSSIWAEISMLPEGVHDTRMGIASDIDQFARAIAEIDTRLEAYCEPLFCIVGELVHDYIKQQYPISSKTALVEVKREEIRQNVFRYAVPQRFNIAEWGENPSPYIPPPVMLTVNGSLFAESGDGRRYWWIGYNAGIDTVFVA